MKILLTLATSLAVLSGPIFAHSKEITSSNVQSVIDDCNAGNGNSCQAMGDLLRMRDKAAAAGQKVDLELSMKYYERACSLGDIGACESKNYLYADKKFSGYDPKKAVPFFQAQCAKKGEGSGACQTLKRLPKDQ